MWTCLPLVFTCTLLGAPDIHRKKSTMGRALQQARARGEDEAVTFERVRASTVPVGLPGPLDRSPRPEGAGTVNIMDYNASNDGTEDVSAIIFRIAADFPPSPDSTRRPASGRTLLFPPGIYLIDPPLNVTTGSIHAGPSAGFYRENGGPLSLPGHIALDIAVGAMLRTRDPLLRVLISAPVAAGYSQVRETPSWPRSWANLIL